MLAAMPASRAADPNDSHPPVVALGNDTYVITRGATFFFFRATKKLVTRARTDAQKFCHELGRKMKEQSVEEVKAGLVIGDFAKARITFKALAPGDPALAETKAPAAPTPSSAGDLAKLDEPRRGGVLVDSEYEAAKKRLARQQPDDLHWKGVLSDTEFEAARQRLDAPRPQ